MDVKITVINIFLVELITQDYNVTQRSVCSFQYILQIGYRYILFLPRLLAVKSGSCPKLGSEFSCFWAPKV